MAKKNPTQAKRPMQIDPVLHDRLKVLADETGMTMTGIVEGVVTAWLDKKSEEFVKTVNQYITTV